MHTNNDSTFVQPILHGSGSIPRVSSHGSIQELSIARNRRRQSLQRLRSSLKQASGISLLSEVSSPSHSKSGCNVQGSASRRSSRGSRSATRSSHKSKSNVPSNIGVDQRMNLAVDGSDSDADDDDRIADFMTAMGLSDANGSEDGGDRRLSGRSSISSLAYDECHPTLCEDAEFSFDGNHPIMVGGRRPSRSQSLVSQSSGNSRRENFEKNMTSMDILRASLTQKRNQQHDGQDDSKVPSRTRSSFSTYRSTSSSSLGSSSTRRSSFNQQDMVASGNDHMVHPTLGRRQRGRRGSSQRTLSSVEEQRSKYGGEVLMDHVEEEQEGRKDDNSKTISPYSSDHEAQDELFVSSLVLSADNLPSAPRDGAGSENPTPGSWRKSSFSSRRPSGRRALLDTMRELAASLQDEFELSPPPSDDDREM